MSEPSRSANIMDRVFVSRLEVKLLLADQLGEVKRFRLARTLLGRGWYFTTAYLVDGLLIDTGCAHTADELIAALEGCSIRQIVNTHSHEDHVGANAQLQARTGAPIAAHALALPFLEVPDKWNLRPYQRLLWGLPSPSRGTLLERIVETERYQFRVIHTPGHSPDHVCLYEEREGWLFSGDTFIGGKDRSLRADYNILEIIDSLRILAGLEPETLFTGSGTVRSDARQEIVSKIAYLEELKRRVRALHAKGMSISVIAGRLFGRETLIAYITLGHFSARNLVKSFIADC